MPRKILLFLGVLIFGVSCKKDFFESIVEVEIPAHQTQLAISAHFNEVLDSVYPIFINNSLSILDSKNIQPIFDAKVRP